MSIIQSETSVGNGRTRISTLGSVALILSPLAAIAALVMVPDTSDEIAMVQSTQWFSLWVLALAGSFLFAVGVTALFGSRIGAGDRSVRTGVTFAWVTVALMGLMYAVNVPAARMLVTPESSAFLPVAQQQGALDIIEALTMGIQPFSVAFLAGAAILFGRAIVHSSDLSSRIGQVGQAVGGLTLAIVVISLVVPGLIETGLVLVVSTLAYDLVLVWALIVGVSVFRSRSEDPAPDETPA